MTKISNIDMFNQKSDWSYEDWRNSDARHILSQMPNEIVEWVLERDMTDKEKAENPTYKTTGGYLRVLGREEAAAQLWWESLSDPLKKVILSLPNFDADIFKQCTGIDVTVE